MLDANRMSASAKPLLLQKRPQKRPPDPAEIAD